MGPGLRKINCGWCGKEMVATRTNQKFCRAECRIKNGVQRRRDKYIGNEEYLRKRRAQRQKRVEEGRIGKYEERIAKCPECGKTFTTIYPTKIACSQKCNFSRTDRRGHYRRMQDSDYRKKRREASKKWRKKMRELGMCQRCGVNPPRHGASICEDCFEYKSSRR